LVLSELFSEVTAAVTYDLDDIVPNNILTAYKEVLNAIK